MERRDWKRGGRRMGSGCRRVVFDGESGELGVEAFLGVTGPALPAGDRRRDLSAVDRFGRDDVASGFGFECPVRAEGIVAVTEDGELGSAIRGAVIEIPVHLLLFQDGMESFEQAQLLGCAIANAHVADAEVAQMPTKGLGGEADAVVGHQGRLLGQRPTVDTLRFRSRLI